MRTGRNQQSLSKQLWCTKKRWFTILRHPASRALNVGIREEMSIADLDFRPIRQRILCHQDHFEASRRLLGMLICQFSYHDTFLLTPSFFLGSREMTA